MNKASGGDGIPVELFQILKDDTLKVLHSLPLTLKQATTDLRLHQKLLDTPRQVWVSLLRGHCSFHLGPGMHNLLVPSKSLFPQSCVSSGGSMVGLMATSSNRAYAIPKSAACRAPAPVVVHR